jgi:hypothetical protein
VKWWQQMLVWHVIPYMLVTFTVFNKLHPCCIPVLRRLSASWKRLSSSCSSSRAHSRQHQNCRSS